MPLFWSCFFKNNPFWLLFRKNLNRYELLLAKQPCAQRSRNVSWIADLQGGLFSRATSPLFAVYRPFLCGLSVYSRGAAHQIGVEDYDGRHGLHDGYGARHHAGVVPSSCL